MSDSKFPFIQDKDGKWWEVVAFREPCDEYLVSADSSYEVKILHSSNWGGGGNRLVVVEAPEIPLHVYADRGLLVMGDGTLDYDAMEKFSRLINIFPPLPRTPKIVPWDCIEDIPDGCWFFNKVTHLCVGQFSGQDGNGDPLVSGQCYVWPQIEKFFFHGPSHKTPRADRKECVKEIS